MSDAAEIEAALTEARDALQEFWEQGEGAVCFLALRLSADALAAYRSLDPRDSETTGHLADLAAEVARLRAPLDGAE
jgi:hypothetical protein